MNGGYLLMRIHGAEVAKTITFENNCYPSMACRYGIIPLSVAIHVIEVNPNLDPVIELRGLVEYMVNFNYPQLMELVMAIHRHVTRAGYRETDIELIDDLVYIMTYLYQHSPYTLLTLMVNMRLDVIMKLASDKSRRSLQRLIDSIKIV